MDSMYHAIWRKAYKYQDKRKNKGHAITVVECAQELQRLEGGSLEIIVPAAILSSVGWAKLSVEKRMSVYDAQSKFDAQLVQIEFEKENITLAKEILEECAYDPGLIERVLEVIEKRYAIGEFDEDAIIVQDAHRLWHYTKRGFEIMSKLMDVSSQDFFEWKSRQVDSFHTESAQKIAQLELEKRKKELLI